VDCRIILGGPDPEVSLLDRTPDDLPVHPRDEKEAFLAYGRRYGWNIVGSTDRERLPMSTLVSLVWPLIQGTLRSEYFRGPKQWCGPINAPVVFVGERGSSNDSVPGGWLPFSSRYTTQYGRILGDAALQCGWTNAWDDRREIFNRAKLVIACGATAQRWAKEVRGRAGAEKATVEEIPHPAALYRWGKYRSVVPRVEALVRELVGQYVTA
jgi:hypothetical protein